MIYLITAIVFLSALLLAAATLHHFVLSKSLLSERLEKLERFFPGEKRRLKGEPQESGTWAYKLSRIGEMVQLPQKEQSKYSKSLVAAGYRRETVYLFLGCKLLLAGALPALYIFLYAAARQDLLAGHVLLSLVAAASIGYLAPTYWLYAKKNNRQLRIFQTLPDVLDLLTICVEAGLSMDAALLRAIETPEFKDDPLGQELRGATMEIRAGKPRQEALRDLAERTMVSDLKSLVAMLSQTERFGTSLSQALRSFADSLRTRRRQIAEEAAAKTAIKMIFPLVLFILPALLVVILGPAVIQITKIFR